MANALDELKSGIENAIHDAEREIKKLEERGHLMDNPRGIQRNVEVNLNLAKSQGKVFKSTLRTYALKKIEVEGAMVPMLSPEEKETYKKFSRNEKIDELEKRLKAAMTKSLSDRAELFCEDPDTADADHDEIDARVEAGDMETGEVWQEISSTQDRTMDKIDMAIGVATETEEIAVVASREQEKQLALTQKINDEVRDLHERYGISFAIMKTILRQIACDGCFQALFCVLMLTIIAFLVVKFV